MDDYSSILIAFAMALAFIGGTANRFLLFRVWRHNKDWAVERGLHDPSFTFFSVVKSLRYYREILRFDGHLRQSHVDLSLLCLSWSDLVVGPLLLMASIIV